MRTSTMRAKYDGNGIRISKTTGVNSTVYVFSGAKVVAEYANGAAVNAPTREYIYSGSRLLATIDASGSKYHLSGHLSTHITTDASGNKIGEQNHYPFGEMWYQTGTTTKWQFTTYERDPETGNDYAMARYHVNRLGRFASVDRLAGNIGNPQSLNRYAYVINNPTNSVDPLGLSVDCAPGSEPSDDGKTCTPSSGGGDPGSGDGGFGGSGFGGDGFGGILGFLGPTTPPGPPVAPDLSDSDPSGFEPPETSLTGITLQNGAGGNSSLFGGGTVTGAINQLKSFSTNLKNCLADLKDVGLTPSTIQGDANSVKMVNALTKPGILARMDPKADFSVVDGAPVPTIAFNPNNYWQTSFGDLLGTLVHEYAHLANPGASGTDQALINALGITGATNTNEISKKFGKDCFPGAKP